LLVIKEMEYKFMTIVEFFTFKVNKNSPSLTVTGLRTSLLANGYRFGEISTEWQLILSLIP